MFSKRVLSATNLFIVAFLLFSISVSVTAQEQDKGPSGMVLIKGGTFMMGSNIGVGAFKEQPIHQVTLDAFYMDKTEVSQADYLSLMGINPSYFKGDLNRPMERVTWFDAILYCNARSKRDCLEPVYSYTELKGKAGDGCTGFKNLKIDYGKNGYRLPTEAEWEYACRAGATTRYYWGDSIDGDYAWCTVNSGKETHPVGMKKPNAWGLYDMSGNVWEWCNDWYEINYYTSSPEKNPRGPESGEYHIVRGGSWEDSTDDLRSAKRSCYSSTKLARNASSVGFRCVIAPKR